MSEEKHLEQMSMLPTNPYGEAVPTDQASAVHYQEAYNVFRCDEGCLYPLFQSDQI